MLAKIVQTECNEVCFKLLRCSLSYAKVVQTRAMKTCFQIAECSLSYAKVVQTRAMKTCFQIAECSLSYAKVTIKSQTTAFQLSNYSRRGSRCGSPRRTPREESRLRRRISAICAYYGLPFFFTEISSYYFEGRTSAMCVYI